MGELFRVSYKHIVILIFPFLLIGLLYEIEDWLLNIGILGSDLKIEILRTRGQA